MKPKEQSCESTLVVAPAAKGKFLSFAYTWSHEGADHEGLLIVGNANKAEEATGAFIDSWHMNTNVMQFKGSVDEQGVIHLLGTYAGGSAGAGLGLADRDSVGRRRANAQDVQHLAGRGGGHRGAGRVSQGVAMTHFRGAKGDSHR